MVPGSPWWAEPHPGDALVGPATEQTEGPQTVGAFFHALGGRNFYPPSASLQIAIGLR